MIGADEDIDVPDRLLPAAQAATHFYSDDAGTSLQALHQLRGQIFRQVEPDAVHALVEERDPFKEFLLRLLAETAQGRDAPVLAGGLELLKCVEAELLV